MKIKTAKLTDVALDWAVTSVVGKANMDYYFPMRFRGAWLSGEFKYATSDSLSGPLIDENLIATSPYGYSDEAWHAVMSHRTDKHFTAYGDTRLIAAMRCFVMANLGNEVDIPGVLL